MPGHKSERVGFVIEAVKIKHFIGGVMDNTQIIVPLATAMAQDDGYLNDIGIKVGKLYTDHGLPIDMALDRLPHDFEQKIVILNSALSWLVEHRRNSGATDKAVDRQRKANREIMARFLKTKETGAY
jgi:hypothetical protein